MKKKIAIVCEWAGIVHRGGESFAIELGNYLSHYYDVDMYTRAGKIDSFEGETITIDYQQGKALKIYNDFYSSNHLLQKIINSNRYTSIFTPGVIQGYHFAKCCFKKMQEKSYDVIYPVTGPGGHWMAKKYRKATKTPFFATGGGGIGPWEWWVLKTKPDVYVCISSEQYDWARKYYKQIQLIPNGTNVNDYNIEDNQRKYFINENNKLVISVGNLDTIFKRHQLTIEAVSKLDNVDLLILGYGEEKDTLEQLANQLMPGRCRIMGVPHSEIAHFYKSADCFALPSLGEPFGIVYIEAMAAGLPCIGTDDQTRRDIIAEAGYTCDVENPIEYAECIKKAIEKNWGDLPYHTAEKYDYSIIGERYYRMIEEIS